MRAIFSLILLLVLLVEATTTAQNPYAPLGVETEVLTLTEGKYPEFIPNQKVVTIGDVRLNTVTGEVIEFIDSDTVTYSFDPTIATRFLSVDPIARQFPELTPYQFASNSPIAGIDLDGLEFSLSTTRNNEVYINAHFKIVNSSNLSDQNLNLLISEGLKPKYLELINRQYNGNNFKGWITFEFVDEVEPGDFYIEFVQPKDEKLRVGNRHVKGRVDDIGGTNITFSTLGLKNEDFGTDLLNATVLLNEGDELSTDVLHEMGHLLGLLHPWDKREVNEHGTFAQPASIYKLFKDAQSDPHSEAGEIIRTNLMNSGGNPVLFLAPIGGEEGTLTDDQFGQLYNNVYQRDQQQKQQSQRKQTQKSDESN